MFFLFVFVSLQTSRFKHFVSFIVVIMLNQIVASGTLAHLVLLLPQIWNGLFFFSLRHSRSFILEKW